nr:MAG: RNA-dependent RNA polymerase [Mitoviridae sp.]
MDIASIESDACKAITSLGFSKMRTHTILNGFNKSLQNNGPEWVVARLNSLRDYYVDPTVTQFPAWIKKRRRSDGTLRPTGWLGSVVGAHTDLRTVVTLMSTISKTVVLNELTDKQLSKWKEAVVEPPPAFSPDVKSLHITRRTKDRMETRLRKKLESRPFFGPDNIGGTRIPIGDTTMSIKLRNEAPDLGDLTRAWELSITRAPAQSWYFQDSLGINTPGLSTHQNHVLMNSMSKRAPDSKHRLKPNRKTMKLEKRSGRPAPPPKDYPVGSISFLQQPSGKLRTVANPNRFVQWQLEPLGEVLSDVANAHPDVYTLDQEAGIRWIQSKLKDGCHMTSADLSSASDTLDYKMVTHQLKSKERPLLTRSLEYFERCSSAPWAVSDLRAQEYLGSPVVRWDRGQPLGLRPSFPILTLCNLAAAQQAVKDVDGNLTFGHFAIVGDDIVIESKYAGAYSANIAEMGGVANLEKSMSSDRRAEFCSRIIEPDTVYRLKPRYILDNDPQNILTYQDTGVNIKVKGWLKSMTKRVGSYHILESGLVPHYRGDQPATLDQKNLVHAVLSLSKGETPPEKDIVSMETMFLHGRSSRSSDYVHKRARPRHERKVAFREMTVGERWDLLIKRNPGLKLTNDVYKYAPVALRSTSKDVFMDRFTRLLAGDAAFRANFPGLNYPRLGDQDEATINPVIERFAREQSVSGRTVYNYRTDSRERVVNPVTALKKLDMSIQKIKESTVTDSSGTHFLSETESRILTVLEDERKEFSLYFVDKNGRESTRVKVPKTLDTRHSPLSYSSFDKEDVDYEPELWDVSHAKNW